MNDRRRRIQRAISILATVTLLLTVLPLFVGHADAAVTQKAAATSSCVTVTTCNVVLTLPAQLNGALLVSGTVDSQTGTPTVQARSLTFTLEAHEVLASTAYWGAWVAQNLTISGSTTIYLNWSGNGQAMLTADWLGNVTAATAIDAVGTPATANSTAPAASVTTTVAGDMVVLAVGSEYVHATGAASPFTTTGGATVLSTGVFGSTGSGGAQIGWYGGGSYLTDAATGSFTETGALGHTANWGAVAVAFKAAAVPPLPTAFAHGVPSSTDVPLSWANGVGVVVNITVQDALYSGGSCGAYTTANSTGGKVTAAVVEGLTPATAYCFRIQSFNSTGGSGWTTAIQATTAATLTAAISAAPTTVEAGHRVVFTGSTTGGQTLTYLWTFGDGHTATTKTVLHAFNAPGVYQVYFNVSDNAILVDIASATVTITVILSSTTSFSWNPALPEAGVAVRFTPSIQNGFPPYGYAWAFGDGATSTLADPSHAYSTRGNFSVWMNVTEASSAIATDNQVIFVSAIPVASFSFTPASPSVAAVVYFTGVVAHGVAPFVYSWTFGDGGTSAILSPTHAYGLTGNYTVDFNVTDSNGLTATSSAVVTVTAPALSVTLAVSPTDPNASQIVSFASFTTGGVQPYAYSWVFGDGGRSGARDPTHTFNLSGSFTVHLYVTDADGKNASTHVSVTVTPSTGGNSSSSGISLDAFIELDLSIGAMFTAVSFVGAFIGGQHGARPPRPPLKYR